MEYFAIAVGLISLLKPPIMGLLIKPIDNLFDEQSRKSAKTLVALLIGVIVSIIVKLLGGFDHTWLEAIIIGTGMSYSSGQVSYRAKKLLNGKK